jgi:hypothetical protein
MIRLALRLTVAGGREAIGRLLIITAAVALGVGMLLAALSGINGVNAKNARYAWLNSSLVTTSANGTADPTLWRISRDYFGGRVIARVDVAGTGPTSPAPPGLTRPPGSGEYYASPSMAELLRTHPADQLGDRYPGHLAGTVPADSLPAPNSLVIVVGYAPDQLRGQPDVRPVRQLETVPPSECDQCIVGFRSDAMDLVLGVVALAVLFPVLIFIGTASRLAAARREQRFAAMRLVGAVPRQISTIATVEATLSAVAGTVLGFVVFLVFRPLLAKIPFTGEPFYPADLSLNAVDVVCVVLGVPLGAAVAARLALRRVQITPLGVSRRVTPRPPRAYRLIPLLAGLAELAYIRMTRPPQGSTPQLIVYMGGMLLVMVGLVMAGPWLTVAGARLLVLRTGRPAALIAGRRLADNPKAGFRAVSGLVVALFVTSVAVGIITSIMDHRGNHGDEIVHPNTISSVFWPDGSAADTPGGAPKAGTDPVPPGLTDVPGVTAVVVLRLNPAWTPDMPPPGQEPAPVGLVSCAALAAHPEFGRCEPGAQVAAVDSVDLTFFLGPRARNGRPATVGTWPASSVPLERLPQLPTVSIVVDTDGSTGAIEATRTKLERAYPNRRNQPIWDGDKAADNLSSLVGWQQLANVAILASLLIAGCGLAVSIVGGLTERRRPFSLLRLAGLPLGMLRRVVLLESLVPLVTVAVLASGAGFLAAHLFLKAQMQYALRPPGVAYYLLVLAGVAASVGIVWSTLPLLDRVTGPEVARNE